MCTCRLWSFVCLPGTACPGLPPWGLPLVWRRGVTRPVVLKGGGTGTEAGTGCQLGSWGGGCRVTLPGRPFCHRSATLSRAREEDDRLREATAPCGSCGPAS